MLKQLQQLKTPLLFAAIVVLGLSGCKYYGGALPPENPVSMDSALQKASGQQFGAGADGEPIPPRPRPQMDRPSYLPEKELAVVEPPKTLLVWTYPHVTDDNTRVFGNWSTIFVTDRYEWVKPSNEVSMDMPEVTDGR